MINKILFKSSYTNRDTYLQLQQHVAAQALYPILIVFANGVDAQAYSQYDARDFAVMTLTSQTGYNNLRDCFVEDADQETMDMLDTFDVDPAAVQTASTAAIDSSTVAQTQQQDPLMKAFAWRALAATSFFYDLFQGSYPLRPKGLGIAFLLTTTTAAANTAANVVARQEGAGQGPSLKRARLGGGGEAAIIENAAVQPLQASKASYR